MTLDNIKCKFVGHRFHYYVSQPFGFNRYYYMCERCEQETGDRMWAEEHGEIVNRKATQR